MKNKSEIVLKVIGLTMFLLIIATVIAAESNNCDGQLVRGLFWFECVENK
jgi:hypothetical protein